MKCPNCRCEIGNLSTCPYCGVVLYRQTQPVQPTKPIIPQNSTNPMETRQVSREMRPRQEIQRDRHMSNLDTWGLLCAILLGGIFVLELLQLVIMLQ